MSDWFDEAPKPEKIQPKTNKSQTLHQAVMPDSTSFDWQAFPDEDTTADVDSSAELLNESEEENTDLQAIEDNDESTAGIEVNSRDKYYDDLSNAGKALGQMGRETGQKELGISGAIVSGTAYVGKKFGQILDKRADLADDAAAKISDANIKHLRDIRDQKVLDKINKGGGRIIKDD